MATEVEQQLSTYWIYDSLSQLFSRFRSKSFIESQQCYARRNQSIFINELPVDILLHIFKCLDQKTVAKCERVCKDWCNTIRSAGTQLWNRAEISYAFDYDQFYRVAPQFPTCQISNLHYKMELYVQYLLLLRPRITVLSVEINFLDARAFRAIEFLLTSGYCANLKEVKLRWHTDVRGRNAGIDLMTGVLSDHLDGSVHNHNAILRLLAEYAPGITRLSTQLSFGFDSLKALERFTNLQDLHIICAPRVHLLISWHIEKLLSKLTKLRAFQIEGTVNPMSTLKNDTLMQFKLASPSIEVLNLVHLVNFVVSEADLPNLVSLQCDMTYYNWIQYRNGFPCLFDVLAKGCPKLREINGIAVNPTDVRSGLPRCLQKELDICYCPRKHHVIDP